MENKAKTGTVKDLELGKRIKLKEYQTEHIEKKALDFVMAQSDDWEWKGNNKEYWINHFSVNVPKVKRWSDYAVYLINTQRTTWIRENWIRKVKTSIKHWSTTGSVVDENIRDAALVLSDTVDLDFSEYKEPFTKKIWWDQFGLSEISRKPVIKFFNYPEDSVENQARYYIYQLVKAIKDGGEREEKAMKELYANKTLRALVFGENGTMENITELPESLKYNQLPWACQEDLVNIPTGKDARNTVLKSGKIRKAKRARTACDKETLLKALERGAERYFHDDLRASANWKRVVVAVLRGDVNFTYMGFSPSAEQMQIRAEGLAAFSTTKEERDKALKEFERLKIKAEKEKEIE